MVKGSRSRRPIEKRAVIITRLIPTPEAYEDKTNSDVEKEILESAEHLPYVAEIERTRAFNSPAGRDEVAAFKSAVMDAMAPVHTAVGEAARMLAGHDITVKTLFDAAKGFLVVTLKKQEAKE